MSEQAGQPEAISPQRAIQAGSELLGYFDVNIDPATHTDEFIDAMRQLNPRYKGDRTLVRFELEQDQTEWPADMQGITMTSAVRLRMVEPEGDETPLETPLEGDFDIVGVLGAARQAPKDRALYAARAIHEGRATAQKVVIVGSARKLGEAEQENTANYAPGAVTEFDLCVGAAEAVKQEFPEIEVETMFVDSEKAGTPQVVEHILSELQSRDELPEGARLAAVTTQIYQTATSLDVARVAERFGISDTLVAGNPSDPNIVAKRTPATYLSEILRTMRAAALALQSEQKSA